MRGRIWIRRFATLLLGVFLVYTGAYVFVYLFRAFRFDEPASDATVLVWHGDPMIRAVLVSVLFAIGLLVAVMLLVTRPSGRGRGTVRLRADLWEWIERRSEEMNETPEQLADRALATYRSHVESARATPVSD